MIPIYKLLSLLIRVFSRPLINYIKNKHLKNNDSSFRGFFLKTGNVYHRLQYTINRKFLKLQSEIAHKPLNDQLAVEKGIQFSHQILFYSIMIGLPVYQMIRGSIQSEQSKRKLEHRLKQLQQKIQHLNKKQIEKYLIEQSKLKIEKQKQKRYWFNGNISHLILNMNQPNQFSFSNMRKFNISNFEQLKSLISIQYQQEYYYNKFDYNKENRHYRIKYLI